MENVSSCHTNLNYYRKSSEKTKHNCCHSHWLSSHFVNPDLNNQQILLCQVELENTGYGGVSLYRNSCALQVGEYLSLPLTKNHDIFQEKKKSLSQSDFLRGGSSSQALLPLPCLPQSNLVTGCLTLDVLLLHNKGMIFQGLSTT